MIILNKKRFLILAVFTLLVAIVDVFVITNKSSYSANSGGSNISGGSSGCLPEYDITTCAGASWQYYAHDFKAKPTTYISAYDNYLAPGATISGCGDATGYYRYAWVNKNGQVGTAAVGAAGGREVIFASIFYWYYWWDGYVYDGNQWSWDNYYDGYYGWVAGRGGMNYAQGFDHWTDVLNKFEKAKAQGFVSSSAVQTWDKDSSLSWFCYADTYTLTGVAVDENGNKLGNDPGSVTVASGRSASLTAKDIENYEFKGWRSSQSSGMPSGGATYTVNSLTSNTTVYAVYEEASRYEGYSAASTSLADGSTRSIDTGWRTESWTEEAYWSNGSGVNFAHGVRRTKGKALSKYDVFNNKGIFIAEGGDITADSPDQNRVSHNNVNIKVGDPYCETLSFPQKSSAVGAKVETKACVNIPYNFENEAQVTQIGNKDKVVYAGETADVNAKVIVKPRYNGTTDSTYATDVNNAKYQIIVYLAEQNAPQNHIVANPCQSSNCVVAKEGLINGDGHISVTDIFKGNDSTVLPGDEVGVPDVDAGSKFCAAVAIYPANSVNDKNMSSDWTALGASWYLSDPMCATIAKKPLLQIYGGGLSSNGKINTLVNTKYALKGYRDYKLHISTADERTLFGSWTENALTAKGAVSGIMSGAAAGYTGEDLFADPGGLTISGTSTFNDKRNILTIANVDGAGNSGVAANQTLRDWYKNYASSEENRKKHEGYIYYSENNTFEINSDLIKKDNNGKAYTSAAEVEQYIIYAKNINIKCNVTRIDAILIADGTVNTCSDANDGADKASGLKNDSKRSRQLTINGAVIADKIVLGRTYGAATGNNSIVPAEIIDAIPTTYYWLDIALNPQNDNNGSQSNNTNFYTSYQREIAPRY